MNTNTKPRPEHEVVLRKIESALDHLEERVGASKTDELRALLAPYLAKDPEENVCCFFEEVHDPRNIYLFKLLIEKLKEATTFVPIVLTQVSDGVSVSVMAEHVNKDLITIIIDTLQAHLAAK
jgi:hypothetical protein